MTLIELMISMAVLGSIVLVTSTAVLVVLRQRNDTEARLDVARWEQGLATWLPADLASATDVDADASATQPGCSISACTTGLNALTVSWDDGGETVSVAYRYGPGGAGGSYTLTRVKCRGTSCTANVVLNELDGPRGSDGQLLEWSTVTEVPNSIIDVTLPLDVVATAEDGSTIDEDNPARRVIIEVNGRPDVDGEVRSSRVSLTAGGQSRDPIDAPTFEGIDFTEANSGCGGPTTLVIDRSRSINSNISDVRSGIAEFVKAFDGTPTDLEVVQFNSNSSSWTAVDPVTSETIDRFDLSNRDHVELLIGADGTGGLASALTAPSGGGTNWEDAMHRVFYNDDGTIDSPRPKTIVFFTDGEPTFGRTSVRSSPGPYGPGQSGVYDTNSADASPIEPDSIEPLYQFVEPDGGSTEGSDFNPRGWYRANHILSTFEAKVIGVGVGDTFFEDTVFTGSARTAGWPNRVPNEAFLGRLIKGGQPHTYNASSPGYTKRVWNSTDGWGEIANADLLVTDNWAALGAGLKEIALVDCGGTLTVQTQEASGTPADADVTYEIDGSTVTTTRIQRARTFDIALGDGTPITVDLVPQPLDSTGYTADSWLCRAGGSDMTFGTEYSLIGADAADGVRVTVDPNEAVSCTLTVN